FQVGGGNALPDGLASVVISGQEPGKISLIPEGKESEWGVESVAIGGRAGSKISMKVARGDFVNASTVSLELSPLAFFRGKVLRASAPVRVEIAPVTTQFTIEMRSAHLTRYQTNANFGRRVDDQFQKHPDACYVYMGSGTEIDISVTYIPDPAKPPIPTAIVSVLLDDQPISGFEPKSLKLKASVSIPAFIALPLHSRDVREGPEGSLLTVEIKNEVGQPLARPRRLRVRVIDPSLYYQTRWSPPVAVPPSPGNPGGVLYRLTIRRSGADPTSRDVNVHAEMIMPPVPWSFITHSKPRVNEGNRFKAEPKWWLLHDEWLEYSLFLPEGFVAQANGPDGLQYRVSVGDFQLRNLTPMNANLAAPAPTQAPAGGAMP
ncbi:MAG: hypothetical protein AB7I30_00730, partial [Isosphaeraceae bacterium]